MDRTQAVKFLITSPYKFGHLVGFTKLTELHNKWICDMIIGDADETLQAHRGSYKTTCVSIALAIIVILFPNKRILFLRKTDYDVTEVLNQVKKILEQPYTQYFVNTIYKVNFRLIKVTSNEILTNLSTDTKGTSQIVGLGLGGSLTGKHFDLIFTDDIVNVNDRTSKAERDRTKLMYQELQNIKNRGGRFFNTGTPWHAEDAFTLMPNPQRWDCYSTGLMSEEEIQNVKSHMVGSLFAANYELRHIASDDVIFLNPHIGADPTMVEQGDSHIDAAYGGSDFTAYTILKKLNGKYYVFGKLWGKHVDDCLDEIQKYQSAFNVGRIACENNGDKGYLGKELRKRGLRTAVYHESMNKFIKITSYLKAAWDDIVFVDGTDKEYINQICDYTEDAEHDDAPDSLASLIRKMWYKDNSSSGTYKSVF